MKLSNKKRILCLLWCAVSITYGFAAYVGTWEELQSQVYEEIRIQDKHSKGSVYVSSIYQQLQASLVDVKDPITRMQLQTLIMGVKQQYGFDKDIASLQKKRYAKKRVSSFKKKKKSPIYSSIWDSMWSKTMVKNKKPLHTTREQKQKSKKVGQQGAIISKVHAQHENSYTKENKWNDLRSLDEKHKENLLAQNDSIEQEWYDFAQWRIHLPTVQDAWIALVNDFRREEWVSRALIFSPLLQKTAMVRSQDMLQRSSADHKRTSTSAYYDYEAILWWFMKQWISFELRHGTTFTENVWRSWFRCVSWDCTQEAIDALGRVFTYFAKEKWTSYDAHYRTMVQQHFTQVWLGLAVDEKTWAMYSTMHYAVKAVPISK